MDFFSRTDLEELLEASRDPSVSIYLPPGPGGPDPERDRLRFRAALERAQAELEKEDGRFADGDESLEALAPLARDREAWVGSGGVAVFHAPGFVRRYRLPVEFPDLVVVAPTFHTKPMLEYLQAPDRFWILELGQGQVRLWRGDARTARPLEDTPLPTDMDSALGYEYGRDPEVVHRGTRPGSTAARNQSGGSVGAFHGHGAGHDDREPSLKRFFRAVDDALVELIGPDRDPVILAAVAEHHPVYRSLTRLQNLGSRGIEGAIRDWPADRVHEAAWPIALEEVEARIDTALELWERSYGPGKAEVDVGNLGPLAVAGRIRALLTEKDRRLWGHLDLDTGRIEVLQDGGDDPDPSAVEVLDELSELVISKGGSTLILPADRMPTESGAAGILR